MKIRLLALVAAIVLLLSGCGGPLAKLVNAKFPPITLDEQRVTTVKTNTEALAAMTAPNIGLGVYLPDAKTLLYTEALKKQGVPKLEFDGDEQLLRLTVAFDRTGLSIDTRQLNLTRH